MKQGTFISSATIDTNIHSTIKKILYATDLSSDAPKVFQYVLSLARQFGAEVTSLHVIDRYSDDVQMTFTECFSKETRKKMAEKNLKEAMDEMLYRDTLASSNGEKVDSKEGNLKQLGIKSINNVVCGNVEEQILKYSEKINPDLIILGAHKKNLTRTYSSTVSKRVVKRSKVPVTIVPICD